VAVPLLIKLLHCEESEIRELAASKLGVFREKSAVNDLLPLLEDARTRTVAVKALGLIGDKSAIPRLIQLLNVQDQKFYISQLTVTLCLLEAHEAVPTLLEIFQKKDKWDDCTVATAIAKLGDFSITDRLSRYWIARTLR
jgi:HEAT repeat protein